MYTPYVHIDQDVTIVDLDIIGMSADGE